MSNPQQPELRRSGHTPVDQDHAKETASTDALDAGGGVAPVPPGNEPGHHPPVEQDKPTGPPPSPDAGNA